MVMIIIIMMQKGIEEEVEREVCEGEQRKVILASNIAAKTVNLPNVKYVIIHPLDRVSSTHYSGMQRLIDVPSGLELANNKAGWKHSKKDAAAIHIVHFGLRPSRTV